MACSVKFKRRTTVSCKIFQEFFVLSSGSIEAAVFACLQQFHTLWPPSCSLYNLLYFLIFILTISNLNSDTVFSFPGIAAHHRLRCSIILWKISLQRVCVLRSRDILTNETIQHPARSTCMKLFTNIL